MLSMHSLKHIVNYRVIVKFTGDRVLINMNLKLRPMFEVFEKVPVHWGKDS